MKQHGHNIDSQRSRPLIDQDLQTFDCILVMDAQNLADTQSLPVGQAEIQLFVPKTDVPDPYYGEGDGFMHVYEMLDKAAENWIKTWSA